MNELTKKPPKSFDEMVADMLKCEQTPGQSVYQHGISVNQHFDDLMDYLNGLYSLPEGRWKLPEWLETYKGDIIANLHNRGQIERYLIFHDAGKPYCRTWDGHFPNHAAVSKYIWSCIGGNDRVGHLIGEDMVMHSASAEEIDKKLDEDWTEQDACTLLLAALCEIHSNAKMFGGELGIKSEQFKMKWKQIDRRGKQICKKLFMKAANA